jgi:hypothetical protein
VLREASDPAPPSIAIDLRSAMLASLACRQTERFRVCSRWFVLLPQINVPEIKKETEKLQQEEVAYLREAK